MPQPLQIDFVADVVCPWCFIGWRRLEAALALRPDVEAQVVWRPYQLDPTIPEEGVDRHAYMAAKFGSDPDRRAAMLEALNAAGSECGLDLKLADIPISPNTNAAHRLIRWAQGAGLQREVLEAVMTAYFTELRDIGDPVVLADIAEKAGMERLMVLKLLSEGADKDAVSREHMMATQAASPACPSWSSAARSPPSAPKPLSASSWPSTRRLRRRPRVASQRLPYPVILGLVPRTQTHSRSRMKLRRR